MIREFRATYSNGTLKLSEELDLNDGDEVTIAIDVKRARSVEERRDALRETAGGWRDSVDCEKLIDDIYSSRAIVSTRIPNF